MSENVPLNPNQLTAIAALLTGNNFDEASQKAGVNRRTLNRWLKDENFKDALTEGQTEITRHALRRLSGLLEKSIDELETLLTQTGLKPHEKLMTIRTILNGFARVHEGVGLEDRLDEIERLLK